MRHDIETFHINTESTLTGCIHHVPIMYQGKYDPIYWLHKRQWKKSENICQHWVRLFTIIIINMSLNDSFGMGPVILVAISRTIIKVPYQTSTLRLIWRSGTMAADGLVPHITKSSPGMMLNIQHHYRQVSNIRCTLVGNKIVYHSDVVGASPVGVAPTTSSFST